MRVPNLNTTPWQRNYLRASTAIARCTDENYRQYMAYGGRGIKIHEPWLEDPRLRRRVDKTELLSGHEPLPQLLISPVRPKVHETMERLPLRMALILCERFWHDKTLDQVARQWDLSKERVMQIEAKALQRLRQELEKL